MGIFCEITLHKPENGAFIGTAGTVVSGLIKYAVDEETVFYKITVSLKGMGTLHVEKKVRRNQRRKYHNSEIYFDIDDVISKDNDVIATIGNYEIPFRFEIPQNVPPTLAYKKKGQRYSVKCNITYYIRIKFNRTGLMNFDKRFKKEITVISDIIPRLATTPIIYGRQKKLTQLFTRDPSIVNIKANILDSVLKAGDKISLICEVTNHTNLVITSVKTKLVEVYTFYMPQREITRNKYNVPGTDSKTGKMDIGEIREILIEINIPGDRASAEFSKIFSRDYFVSIIVYLPIPHRNHVLDIPIQIGNRSIRNIVEANCNSFEDENPPSYWEAMNE